VHSTYNLKQLLFKVYSRYEYVRFTLMIIVTYHCNSETYNGTASASHAYNIFRLVVVYYCACSSEPSIPHANAIYVFILYKSSLIIINKHGIKVSKNLRLTRESFCEKPNEYTTLFFIV